MTDRRVLAIYVLSGAAGLVYEVVWSRLLALAAGAEATAVTAVLAAFMGGLALGAHLGGRFARRTARPLRDYGLLEVVLGVVCLLVPLAIRSLTPLLAPAYAAFGPTLGFHAVRALACALVLFVPTTLMGATLPVLARGAEPGKLYAANTFGAVFGALLAGFLLIPALGVSATNALAAATSISVGLASIALGRSREALPLVEETGARVHLALLGFALSGAAAMAFQIAWTRAFAIILGPTTYSFSIMLAAYILGHAVGSARAARKAPKLERPLDTLAFFVLGASLAALAVVPLVDWIPPYLMPSVNRTQASFLGHAAAQLALAFAFVALPAGLFGTAFALVTRRAAPGPAYAANSLGAVLGTIGAALVLPVRGVGIGGTLGIAATVAALSALVFALASERRRVVFIVPPLLVALVAWKLPARKPLELNSGSYLYGATGSPTGGSSADEVLAYREGFSGAVLVARGKANGALYLKIDGKVDAGTGAGDMRTQLLLGHVPCLLAARPPERALVVGLGSGVTLRAVLAHSVPKVDLVEIEPALVDCVQETALRQVSRDAVSRARLLVADARAVYALEPSSYDVIVSEPSNPWIAGIGNLFTKEAFELAKARLAPGGVFCQWVHAGYSSPEMFKLVCRTFRDVFPRACLFEVAPDTDYLLVARREGEVGEASEERFTPAVAHDLELLELASARDVVAFHRVLGPDALATFAGAGPLNRDDTALLEFQAPLAVTSRVDWLHDPDFGHLRDHGIPARDLALEALASAHSEDLPREECSRILDLVERAAREPGNGPARPLLRLAVAISLHGVEGPRGDAPEDLVARGVGLLEALWSGPPPRRADARTEKRIGDLLRKVAHYPDNVSWLLELAALLEARGDTAGAERARFVARETDPSPPR